MLAQHRPIGLKSAGGDDDRVRWNDLASAILFNGEPDDLAVAGHNLPCGACISKPDAGVLGRTTHCLDQPGAAADRLNTRRTLGEIIRRLDEFDAVRL